jgi:dipeptide/tripeptide permease
VDPDQQRLLPVFRARRDRGRQRFFKPNAGNLVRKIYEGDDTRIDSAFTIYYMAVNIGSMISMTLTPWIRDYVAAHYGDDMGWHTAFGVCAIGLILGLINYFSCVRALAHIGSPPTSTKLNMRRALPEFSSPLAMVFVGGLHSAERGVAEDLRVCRRRGHPRASSPSDPQQPEEASAPA